MGPSTFIIFFQMRGSMENVLGSGMKLRMHSQEVTTKPPELWNRNVRDLRSVWHQWQTLPS